MIRARRFSRLSNRRTSLVICLALVLSLLVISQPIGTSISFAQRNQQPRNDKARKVRATPPEKRLPFANLPNLDDIGRQPSVEPEAPPSFSSSVRSKRKPPESRSGKRVGDPGTTGTGITRLRTGSVSERIETASRSRSARAKTERDAATRHHAKKSGILNRTRTAAPLPVIGDDQYIQNFFYWGLLRYPDAAELAYWNDILRTAYAQTAYAHGQSAMQIAMRELGRTIFESAEYAARNRDNHWYVYDLYKTFLMRDPDSGGWAYWEALVPSIGRPSVRHGFEFSTEFANLMATITPNGAASGNAKSLVTARIDPFNQTGNQLKARDGGWSLPLISLPGRSGLDLGLGLSYSSMVWTLSAGPSGKPYLYFDEDNSSISPGFRLGFATIQGPLFDAQTARNVYLLVTSSGQRVELRQLGTSSVYDAGDSSYLQLTDTGADLLLRTTDGTKMTYGWFDHEWRVKEIKDRNGNYLTITNDWRGDIQNIIDTLGRVINFNYDGNANLTSITQSWNGGSHTWATFGWGAAHPMNASGFTGASVVGTYTGESIPVLRQVGLHSGSYFTFDYTGAGQVNIIRSYRPDNVQRAYTAYDYNSANNDCPRITQTRVWAENWTGGNGVPSEVTTQFNLPGDGSHQMIAPDGTVYREYYGTGWQKGLVTQSETWSGGVRQKWTTVSYTQDNTSVSYQTNPRVTETNVYDAGGNRRRTTIDYGPYASYGLPNAVVEYRADGVSLLRVTYTDYNLSQAFLDRRIIGLVSAVHVSDGQWQSKTTYEYDTTAIDPQATAATMHDQNYHASFTSRGNATSVSRWDVTDISNSNKKHTGTFTYNAAGSVSSSTDPATHTTTIGYGDSFSDGNNSRGTFAYPTTVTDAGNFSSFVQYNFDFGAKTRVQGPPPAGHSQGAIQTLAYDGAARLLQVTAQNNGAYTRYVYGPFYVQSYSTVNTVADEAYAVQVFDGVGRVFGTANNHPGSAGGYRLVNTIYDQMGRLVKQSNPFEINNSWIPAGDDATGVFYTQQSYDWQGRPLVTTNTDGTQKYASYAGCGCAGGAVVTLTDEVGRQQRVYSDVLGRQWKTEVLNWNGTVYSATTNTFNGRDQVTLVRQWTGAENGGGAYQDTTMSYDGYGRLQSKHVPEQQDSNGNPTYTTWTYKPDDTVETVTDARGASATYGYNNRHLVTSINYSAPSGITLTPSVSFAYDNAGNRTSMTDGLGSVSYGYNQLSQMTSETRSFNDPNNVAINGVTRTLSYQYNLTGALKKITDPTNVTINYNYDTTGRITGVTGENNLVENVSSYAANIAYRATGAVKDMDYGNGIHWHGDYNQRLLPTNAALSNVYLSPSNPSATMTWSYDYYADARIQHAYDAADNRFDRLQQYDHVGRLKEAYSGREARGEAPTSPADNPYRQTMQHDAWDNLTAKTGRFWRQTQGDDANFTNNRRQYWQYDAEGNVLDSQGKQHTYDANGKQTRAWSTMQVVGGGQTGHPSQPGWEIAQVYEANGKPGKRIETRRSEEYIGEGPETNITEEVTTTYYLYSSVLGAKVVELDGNAQKTKGYVYANGERLAKQEVTPWYSIVKWHLPNAGSNSWVETDTSRYPQRQEMDPMGAEVGTTDPWLYYSEPTYSDVHLNDPLYLEGGDPFDYSGGYEIDGLPVSASEFTRRTGNGSTTVQRTDRRGNVYTANNTLFFGSSVWVDNWNLTYSTSQSEFPLQMGDDGSVNIPSGQGPIVTVNASNAGYFVTAAQGLPVPQNSFLSTQQKKEPCPPVPLHPAEADIDANIKRARQHRPQGPFFAYDDAKWFRNMVKDFAPWDYKRLTPDSRYEDFGNFNYGATGSAIGFGLVTLLSEAGRVQTIPPGMKEKPKEWGYPAGRIWGKGKYPYGDEPKDVVQVEAGRNYYLRKFVLKDCQ